METFTDKLIERITVKKSHVVVGLDPVYDSLPNTVKKEGNRNLKQISGSIVEFNMRIIDAVYDLVPAIKPQIAFYERYGLEGLKAFAKTIRYGKKKGLIVIGDVKRNDIGSTAEAYSQAYIGRIKISNRLLRAFPVDAVTVNPYFGIDGILPFIKDAKDYGGGLFVLVKTSNRSSVELQDLTVCTENQERKLYEMVATLVDKWGKQVVGKNGYSSVGAVVGATFPEDAKILRSLMPQTYFLVPGYGAQGASASDIVHCFNEDGYGALINASRSIIYAYKAGEYTDENFDMAAREAVLEMNRQINDELRKNGRLAW